MDRGFLRRKCQRVAAKLLSAVEVDRNASNQHELNGVSGLQSMLGQEKRSQQATFLYLDDEAERAVRSTACVTWYDAREKHPTRSEFRLYFSSNEAISMAAAGDLLVVCMAEDGSLTFLIAAGGSTAERQLRWLFDLEAAGERLLVNLEPEAPAEDLTFVADLVQDELGLAAETSLADDSYLGGLLQHFPSGFPSTKEFSAYARQLLGRASTDDPDELLMAWMNLEQKLFETYERHLVGERLQEGFGEDVDEFLSFSLSVQNRRKSRAGHAFENHLEEIFRAQQIHHSRGALTERRSRPDFLFPGKAQYDDPDFSADRLTMLGVKTTCKDRWRQVLVEAERIANKHLATLEPSISMNQTDEMAAQNLLLVVPSRLHDTYLAEQRPRLMKVSEFLAVLHDRQCGG